MVAIETFECQETAAEPLEAAEEAIALLEELGLVGQQKLLGKSKIEGRTDRCPYRVMQADEKFVYSVLCPSQTKLSAYARTPIPLRVLQLAAHANTLGIFSEFQVWDAAEAAVKDPVLVAFDKATTDWERRVFILARWGEELETFAVLMKRAAEKHTAKLRESLTKTIGEAKARLECLAAGSLTNEEMREPGRGYQLYLGF